MCPVHVQGLAEWGLTLAWKLEGHGRHASTSKVGSPTLSSASFFQHGPPAYSFFRGGGLSYWVLRMVPVVLSSCAARVRLILPKLLFDEPYQPAPPANIHGWSWSFGWCTFCYEAVHQCIATVDAPGGERHHTRD